MGGLLGILLGIATIALGAKAFSREGLPLTNTKKLTGGGAYVVGTLCILLGVAFIAISIYGMIPRERR